VQGNKTFRGTETIIIDQIYGGKTPHPLQLLIAAAAFASLGIAVARHFFDSNVGTISIFLCVLGLLPTLGSLVDRKKSQSKPLAQLLADEGDRKPRFDLTLALSLLMLFVGVMLAYAAWVLILPEEVVRRCFNGQLAPWLELGTSGFRARPLFPIVGNNLLVMLGVLLLSILYRNGGALLVLCWNASIWGAAFAWFATVETAGGLAAVGRWFVLSASVLPHIVLEATGYILTALVGLLLLRLIVRFRDEALDRRELLLGIGKLGGAALACVVLGAVVETALAPWLLDLLSG
jgi:hypothetical protein